MEDGCWKSTAIDPVSIQLNKDDYLYFINQKDKLARFGLQWEFSSENKIFLNAIPTSIIGKNQRQVEYLHKQLKPNSGQEVFNFFNITGRNSYESSKEIDFGTN